MKWWADLRAIGRAARVDLRDTTRLHLVVFALTMGLFLVDIPAHEAILGIIGGHVYAATSNPLWVGASIGATSLGIELLLSAGVALNLRFFRTATNEWQTRFFDEDVIAGTPETTTAPGRFADAIDSSVLALGLGSSAVVLKVHGHAESPSLAEDLQTGRRFALVLGVFNFCLGAAVSGAAELGRMLGWPVLADALIRVATNPLTYVALLVVRQVLKVRSRRRARRLADANDESVGPATVTP